MSEPRTILLVEPEERVRNYIKEGWLAKRATLLVIEAENGAAAQDRLREHSVDAIVTANFMPDVNGQELIYWIRQQPSLMHLPVIALPFMSNVVDEARKVTRPLHEAGADSVILKFHFKDVLSTLERWRWQRPQQQEPGWALDHL
ncbi:response regulator [Armatimonas rosea]|uniref:CheY-like chemotaxis protein n=1 Tax=Armatimonas rosea TaxID=685828 RepID=A0A7W9SQ11_ARMRO|nr:response regulator [Armatimonas rosea]MBB6050079.1 CheY-like chemotaxis protein [Armatimonas rosea]